MEEYTFTVTIKANSQEDAQQVMDERMGFDEDYDFPYEIVSVKKVTKYTGK
jgi:hypothetical protein